VARHERRTGRAEREEMQRWRHSTSPRAGGMVTSRPILQNACCMAAARMRQCVIVSALPRTCKSAWGVHSCVAARPGCRRSQTQLGRCCARRAESRIWPIVRRPSWCYWFVRLQTFFRSARAASHKPRGRPRRKRVIAVKVRVEMYELRPLSARRPAALPTFPQQQGEDGATAKAAAKAGIAACCPAK